jgi:signal transduction histidine kinase
MMKNRVQRRLTGLVSAIVLMGLGIAFLTLKSQWQVGELRQGLDQVDLDSFLIADRFTSYLHQLNDLLDSYAWSHVRPDAAAFATTSRELDDWIEHQKPLLITAQESNIMQQIDVAYDDYQRVAGVLLTRLQTVSDPTATTDEYGRFRRESQRLFELARDLSRAHFGSREQVLAKANLAISELRALVLVSLGLLFVFALALGAVVYRDMIVPLRVKLVESESLRERQEKLASLGVLAAGVAHEIRNPLTAIKGAVYLQRKKFQAGTPEATDAGIIDREILRLERIVNDFLLFGRPSEPKLEATTADVPVREVQALLEPQLAQDKIQLICEESPPLPITADEEQLKQVLINLVHNAAEAIGHNGVVKLRVRADSRRVAGKETRVVILEVEDNGKGIPAGVQKRLFDPFFTTKENGTGLGLSIAARIIESHHGVLEYQTVPGLGTTFGIVLPSAASHAEPRED